MDGLPRYLLYLYGVSTQSEILYDLHRVDRIAITRMSWVFFFFFFSGFHSTLISNFSFLFSFNLLRYNFWTPQLTSDCPFLDLKPILEKSSGVWPQGQGV